MKPSLGPFRLGSRPLGPPLAIARRPSLAACNSGSASGSSSPQPCSLGHFLSSLNAAQPAPAQVEALPSCSSTPPTSQDGTPSGEPADAVVGVPPFPAWAMLPHPELFKPPLLRPTHHLHVATVMVEAYNPEREHLPMVTGIILQAAYHLGIPCSPPIPTPIRTELHTVLRSGFVHKKSQQNFWRLTHKRFIKAYDANAEVINHWLSFCQAHALRGTNLCLRSQRFDYRPVGWGSQMLDRLAQAEDDLRTLGSLQHHSSTDAKEMNKTALAVDPSEQVKQLAEKLIQEELQPKAQAAEQQT